MLTNLTGMHTFEKKQTLVFLIHSHFAQLLLYLQSLTHSQLRLTS